MDEKQREWHRLFGLAWADFFRGMPVMVDLERDMSLQKQKLDVVIIRREAVPISMDLPDGMEDLAEYNLISFKSHQDKLSELTLEELVGHCVSLRKQVSPSADEKDLLPRDHFRLFAVCARYPQQLVDAGVSLKELKPGVFDVPIFSRAIRVVVTHRLPLAEQNAMLHLFGATKETVAFGTKHYRIRSPDTSTLILQLLQKYYEEAPAMPTAIEELEQLTRETMEKLLKGWPVEKRLEDVSPEEMLAALPPHKRDQLRKLLTAEPPKPPAE